MPPGPLARPLALADPELARVLDAWHHLPPHIRAAVLALIGTAPPASPPPPPALPDDALPWEKRPG